MYMPWLFISGGSEPVRDAPRFLGAEDQEAVVGDRGVERGALRLPVREQLVHRARVDDRARQDVGADLRALLEHAHRDLATVLGGELLEADRRGEARPGLPPTITTSYSIASRSAAIAAPSSIGGSRGYRGRKTNCIMQQRGAGLRRRADRPSARLFAHGAPPAAPNRCLPSMGPLAFSLLLAAGVAGFAVLAWRKLAIVARSAPERADRPAARAPRHRAAQRLPAAADDPRRPGARA